jgi:hypothetical protein
MFTKNNLDSTTMFIDIIQIHIVIFSFSSDNLIIFKDYFDQFSFIFSNSFMIIRQQLNHHLPSEIKPNIDINYIMSSSLAINLSCIIIIISLLLTLKLILHCKPALRNMMVLYKYLHCLSPFFIFCLINELTQMPTTIITLISYTTSSLLFLLLIPISYCLIIRCNQNCLLCQKIPSLNAISFYMNPFTTCSSTKFAFLTKLTYFRWIFI